MKIFLRTLLLIFIVATVGCGGDSAVRPDGDGASTQGADDDGSVIGRGLTDEDGRPLIMRIHFKFDSSRISAGNRETLEAHAAYIKANRRLKIKLEGHCDERGTREYNLALGERRAKAVERMLAVMGVPRKRMSTTSYGEENPMDEASTGSAWQRNRRVEFIY